MHVYENATQLIHFRCTNLVCTPQCTKKVNEPHTAWVTVVSYALKFQNKNSLKVNFCRGLTCSCCLKMLLTKTAMWVDLISPSVHAEKLFWSKIILLIYTKMQKGCIGDCSQGMPGVPGMAGAKGEKGDQGKPGVTPLENCDSVRKKTNLILACSSKYDIKKYYFGITYFFVVING